MPDPIKVLMLASDPFADDQALRLDREARAIMQAIRRSVLRDAFELVTEWAVTIEDLQHLLVTHKPDIVHFAGHGELSRGILLVDVLGNECAVDPHALHDLFEVLQRFVRVVVLNACETLPAAEALGAVVDYAIGMETEISDDAAAAFAAEFYGHLASGMTVKESFALGRIRLKVQYGEESCIPQLRVREGVDPGVRLIPVSNIAQGDDAISSILHDAVTFAAACFPDLAPQEFDAVVRALLDGGANGGGAALQRWRGNEDRIVAECLAAAGERARMREALERDHPFRLAAGIRVAHEAGLLFGASDAIAIGLVRLSAEVAAPHPSAYGGDWLLGVLARGRGPAGTPSPRVLARFAELLRAFYADAALAPAADAALDELLRAGAFAEVLALVRHLRSAAGFDAYGWLRRLADRGDERTVSAVRALLWDELMDVGSDVYSLLAPLFGWLPRFDRGMAAISPSSEMALKLLPEYALEVTGHFDASAGGSRDPRPLLAMDRDALPRNVALLASWLLHPAMPAVCGSRPGVEAAADRMAHLVLEWALFAASDARGSRMDLAGGVPADEVLTALLVEIVEQTDDVRGRQVRDAMVARWEGMRVVYDDLRTLLGWFAREKRRELGRRCELLDDLLARFRELQKPPARTPRFVA